MRPCEDAPGRLHVSLRVSETVAHTVEGLAGIDAIKKDPPFRAFASIRRILRAVKVAIHGLHNAVAGIGGRRETEVDSPDQCIAACLAVHQLRKLDRMLGPCITRQRF